MKKRLVYLCLVILLILGACTSAATPTLTPTLIPTLTPTPAAVPVSPVIGLPQGTDGYSWWNDTVFYEIFVRSFNDSNGDGIGDFNGITAKLDYLQGLGVTGLWLMPINPSPSYHGYDVTDYEAVNPQYGTMADFKNLLNEAHQRGIRVILDMVLNHTSNQHPWFIAAQDPKSPYRNYYIWSDTDPGYNGPWGEQVWYPTSTGYYYAIFGENMPDLNYNNPDVTAAMQEVTRFWLQDVGVDGFRLDAAKHLIEDGTIQADSKSTHAWLQQYFSFYKNINPAAVTVGELSGDDAGMMASYIKNKQLDLAFDFGLAASFVQSAKAGNVNTAKGQINLSYKLIPALQFATFLTNHDQDRLMSQLGNDPAKVKVVASLLLTSPGVPFIYYGEEIGQEGQKPDEDIRRPMQWSSANYAGFSSSIPWESVGPDYQTYNIASETNDPNSILSHYQNLIHLRNEHAALRVGDMNLVDTGDPGIFADLRISQAEAVLALVNLTDAPISNFQLSLTKSSLAAGSYLALPLMGNGPLNALAVAAGGGFSAYQPAATLTPYSTLILQLRFAPAPASTPAK